MKIATKIMCFGAASLILFSIIGFFSYFSVTKLTEANRWVMHTEEVIEQMDTILYLVAEVQMSTRGHIVMHDANFEVSVGASIDHLRDTLGQVRKLTADNALQQKRLDSLEPLVEECVALVRKTIGVYQDEGYDAAMQIVRTGRAQSIVDQVRRLVGEMVAVEKGLLSARVREMEQTARNTLLTIAIGTLLALAFISLFGYLVVQDITQPIKIILRAAESSNRGRFDPLNLPDTNDEFEELAHAFNRMGSRLQDALDEALADRQYRLRTEEQMQQVRQQVERLSLKADQFLSTARERAHEFDDSQATIEAVHETAAELATSASEVSRLARAAADAAERFGPGCESATNAFFRLQGAMDGLVEKVAALERAAGAWSASASDLDAVMSGADRIAADLTVLSMSVSVEAKGGHGAERLAAFLDSLNGVSELARQNASSARQTFGRLDRTAERAALATGEAASAVELARSYSAQLSAAIESLEGTLRDGRALVLRASEAASLHSSSHGLVSQKLDRLANGIARQASYIRLSEERAGEMRVLTDACTGILAGGAETTALAAVSRPS